MFFERIIRGENAGTPRTDTSARQPRRNVDGYTREARAAVREEERVKRAKPMTPAQEELRALLGCVPPFDLLRSSGRNAKSAAALAAADAATAATAGGRPEVGGASLAASLAALRACESTTLRVLQLDALAPGLRVDITSRLKSADSTHLKMRRKGVPFGKVCDARAVRVVLGECGDAPGTKEEVMACYALLEAIHKLYRPVPGEYDDYVAKPKASGYQSLHTAVVGPDGALLEFQVRTRAMHEAAEFGNAAHWLYKDFMSDAVAGEAPRRRGCWRDSRRRRCRPTARSSPEAATRGARLSAGVVCWAEGSRAHVVEPQPGDTLRPGLGEFGGYRRHRRVGRHGAAHRASRPRSRRGPRATQANRAGIPSSNSRGVPTGDGTRWTRSGASSPRSRICWTPTISSTRFDPRTWTRKTKAKTSRRSNPSSKTPFERWSKKWNDSRSFDVPSRRSSRVRRKHRSCPTRMYAFASLRRMTRT